MVTRSAVDLGEEMGDMGCELGACQKVNVWWLPEVDMNMVIRLGLEVVTTSG